MKVKKGSGGGAPPGAGSGGAAAAACTEEELLRKALISPEDVLGLQKITAGERQGAGKRQGRPAGRAGGAPVRP